MSPITSDAEVESPSLHDLCIFGRGNFPWNLVLFDASMLWLSESMKLSRVGVVGCLLKLLVKSVVKRNVTKSLTD